MASSQEFPIVTTERLLLRPLRDSDADGVYALRSNPKVFYWKTPEDRIQSDKWLQGRLSDSLCMSYCVELLHPPDSTNRKVIGLTGGHHLPEIGYIFEPDHWGYGYATEALNAWIEMYWSRFPEGFPLVKEEEARGYLKALTGPESVGSRGVLKKCGFRHVGTEEVEEEGRKVTLDKWRADRPEERQRV